MVRIRLRSEKATRPGKEDWVLSPGRLAPKYDTCGKGWKEKVNVCNCAGVDLCPRVPTSWNSPLDLYDPRPSPYYSPFFPPTIQSLDRGRVAIKRS